MEYKTPKLTVDGIIIKDEKIVLIKMKNDPFKGRWALPGGFVEYNEKVEDAAIREVKEETDLNCKVVKLLGVYSDPARDPRGHTVSIVFLLKAVDGMLKGGDDADDAKFFELKGLPNLSFDHDKIIKDFLRREK